MATADVSIVDAAPNKGCCRRPVYLVI